MKAARGLMLLAALGTSVLVASNFAAAKPSAKHVGAGSFAAPRGIVHTAEPQQSFARNFNPFIGTSRSAAQMMYEPLMIFSPTTNKIIPWLGTSYVWSNGSKVLTIAVRRGVKWSDGKPLTPNDVAFTFNLLKGHPALTGSLVWQEGLVSVTPISGSRIRFTFEKPFTPALYAVIKVPIVPRHVWASENPETFANPDPVATGPFTEVTSFQNQVYEVHRNPHYWQPGKPRILGVNIVAMQDESAQLLALVNGDHDWNAIGISDPKALYTSKDPHNLYFAPSLATWFLYLNVEHAPFDRPVVRKAVSLAIDRNQFNRIGYGGSASPGSPVGLAPQAYGSWLDKKALAQGKTWVASNVARANQMLDAAGFTKGSDGIRRAPDGTKLSFTAPACETFGIAGVQLVAQNLKQIGLDVTVKTEGLGPWIQDLFGGNFDIMAAFPLGFTAPTPFEVYQALMSSDTYRPIGQSAPLNYARYKSAAADALLAKFAATGDRAKQQAIVAQLELLFAKQAPAIPIMGLPNNGEASTRHFVGWPTAKNPYVPLSGAGGSALVILTTIRPR